MFRPVSADPLQIRHAVTRREFLQTGSVSLLGTGLALSASASSRAQAIPASRVTNCILIHLTGGPSHLDTWDMKPNAPAPFRSPFRPIKTTVPGMDISELFPRMARRAHLFSIVRSMHYPASTVPNAEHETLRFDPRWISPYEDYQIVLPHQNVVDLPVTGAGQTLPLSTQEAYRLADEPSFVRDKYGRNRFGQSCLLARRLVERGVRFVTIHMFADGPQERAWDAHGHAPFSTIAQYRDQCGPWLDNGYTSLLEELQERGLYDTTLVLATGEFGRSPRLNAQGGRDHWTGCYSLLLGGGGMRGGQIVGASDDIGAYPAEQPVTPDDLRAMLHTILYGNHCAASLQTSENPLSVLW